MTEECKPNIYPVGTLQEMAAIPDEALPRFMQELPEILKAVGQSVEMAKGIQELTGIVIEPQTPQWIDDDLNERHVTFRKPDGEQLFRVTEKLVK